MREVIGIPGGLPELSDCVSRGRLTARGIMELQDLKLAIAQFESGHDDNTGGSCCRNLKGHDCCLICNSVEGALRGYLEAQ